MTTQELFQLIALPVPVRERFERWEAEGVSVMTPDLESRLLCREKWAEAWQDLTALLGEDPGHLRALLEELTVAARQYPKWVQAGIPLEIYRDTMAFATRYLKDGLAAYGEYCFTAGWWFPRQLALELFRLGSLEFEFVREGEAHKVFFHIPTDASLAPEAVDDSLRRLRDFIPRFFPLRPCPEHRGVYPVIGRVIEGMDEIRRLERVPTRRVDFPIPGVEVNEPVEPQVIEKVELELFGETYPEPVRMAVQDLPPTWK